MAYNVKSLVAGVAFATAAFSMSAQAATVVDVELSLLVDVSGSVNATEFALQRDGYVNAFNSGAIQNAIFDTTGGRVGKIAVNFVLWSGAAQQSVAVDWTLIEDVTSATAFATAVSGVGQVFSGRTAPGSAINFATPLFASNDFDGAFQVIDVSGDGPQNDGADTSDARDAALAAGIDRINGIAIGDDTLLAWYQANIVGGTNGFALQAADFADFNDAVAKKIEAEITGTNPVPLPAAAWLLISGLGAIGAMGWRRRAAA